MIGSEELVILAYLGLGKMNQTGNRDSPGKLFRRESFLRLLECPLAVQVYDGPCFGRIQQSTYARKQQYQEAKIPNMFHMHIYYVYTFLFCTNVTEIASEAPPIPSAQEARTL